MFMCSSANSQQLSGNSTVITNRPLVRKPRLPSLPTTRYRISNEYRYISPTNATTKFRTTTTDSSLLKQADILEINPTDDKLAVAWPVPRRPASKRFRAPSQISTTLSPLLEKLRRPRPSRPAMYSLDGFVPKPSPQFKPTTEAPADVLAWNNKQDLQALGSIARRRKLNPVIYGGNEANEDDNVRKYKSLTKNSTRKPSSTRVRPSRRKGVPGVDFPAFDFIPYTTFDCDERGGDLGGMFADPETKCQVWHLCPGGGNQYKHSFLCPNGTVFNERRTICDWWYNVDC